MELELQTGRLQILPLRLENAAFIIELLNSPGWQKFIGDRNVHSMADALAYIDKILNSENIHYWVVHLKSTGTALGILSFLKRDYLEHFDLGFAFLPEFIGKGYAYEGASALLHMLIEKSQQEILATTMPSNIQSIQLLLKLGFHFKEQLIVGKQQLHVYEHRGNAS